MPKTGLDEFEVSLVKAMLARGMPNKTIQFYFNTPNRAVNSGRISEIKSEARWSEINPASEFELNEFIEHHPLTVAERSPDDPQLPTQNKTAAVFTVLDSGLVDVKPDPPSIHAIHDPAVLEIYSELRRKVEELKRIGHNGLGEIADQLDHFDSALPPVLSSASIVKIWTRGNSLRASLRAHDAVSKQADFHPAKLDQGCAERLRDVVEIFNLFLANDPKGVLLDQLRLGPQERDKLDEALQIIRSVVDASSTITTPAADEVLNEQTDNALKAGKDLFGDQAVALGNTTILNYVITLIKSSFWSVVGTLKKDFWDVWKKARIAGYGYAGSVIVANWPGTMVFLSEHAPAIASFLDKVAVYPALKDLLTFVLSFL